MLVVSVNVSLPSRGAWIEMNWACVRSASARVAPLAGSVDRNNIPAQKDELLERRSPRGERGWNVAPLAGSVDRNQQVGGKRPARLSRSPRGERG